ncbi:MAG: hypothetical protein WAU17_12475 [Nitrospirales bacterium]
MKPILMSCLMRTNKNFQKGFPDRVRADEREKVTGMNMSASDGNPFGRILPMAFLAIALSVIAFLALSLSSMPPSLALSESGQQTQIARGLLLPGEQIILGTVQHVKSDVIQVNIGNPEPLFLSLRAAAEKGITSIQPGDTLKILVSDQNQFIDFFKADYPGWDRTLKGHLLQPLMGDHQWAVIQTEKGTNETYEVDEKARHTVINIPVGMPAVFLLNKENILIDATFGNEGALLHTLARWSKERHQIVHH